MPKEEKLNLYETVTRGLKDGYEKLLQRKAALGQDMVFADEKGMPFIVSAQEALAEYNRKKSVREHSALHSDATPKACTVTNDTI